MRRVLSTSVLIVLLSCGMQRKQVDISGVFRIELKSETNHLFDTTYSDQNQIKIYTDDFYAYTNLKEDSTASFGIGYYESSGDQLKEHNIYSTTSLDSPFVFDLRIEKKEEGYRQTIDRIKINGVTTKLVEEYVKIPALRSSPLDGVWKMEKYCKIINGVSICEERVQYKIYHDGYFMFVQHLKGDSLQSGLQSGFGFGHFEYSNGKTTETNLYSTYPSIIDQPVVLSVDLKGRDKFSQELASDVNNNRTIEFYTKVKSFQ